MKSFGYFSLFLTVILSCSLLIFSISHVVHKNFKDTNSMLVFFQNAKIYDNVSTIVRLEIQGVYPPIISRNILLSGLANKVVEAFVTPNTIATVAGPALRLSVKFAQSPTSIIDDKVVIATAIYKQQAVQVLNDFGLPKFVVLNAKLIIDAVPAQFTLVNLEKRPNSILGLIIKARTVLTYNHVIRDVSFLMILGILLILFLHTIDKIKNFFCALMWSFGSIGLMILFVYFLRMWLIGLFLPMTQDVLTITQNILVTDALSYLLAQVRNIGIIYVCIGFISVLSWRFLNFEKLQIKINTLLHKFHIHIPSVSIKVK